MYLTFYLCFLLLCPLNVVSFFFCHFSYGQAHSVLSKHHSLMSLYLIASAAAALAKERKYVLVSINSASLLWTTSRWCHYYKLQLPFWDIAERSPSKKMTCSWRQGGIHVGFYIDCKPAGTQAGGPLNLSLDHWGCSSSKIAELQTAGWRHWFAAMPWTDFTFF